MLQAEEEPSSRLPHSPGGAGATLSSHQAWGSQGWGRAGSSPSAARPGARKGQGAAGSSEALQTEGCLSLFSAVQMTSRKLERWEHKPRDTR